MNKHLAQNAFRIQKTSLIPQSGLECYKTESSSPFFGKSAFVTIVVLLLISERFPLMSVNLLSFLILMFTPSIVTENILPTGNTSETFNIIKNSYLCEMLLNIDYRVNNDTITTFGV